MVAAPWRRLAQAARWNGQAPHSTTGVASIRASHCQLSNCSAGIIDISRTGSDSDGRRHQPPAQIGALGSALGRRLGASAAASGGAGRRAP